MLLINIIPVIMDFLLSEWRKKGIISPMVMTDRNSNTSSHFIPDFSKSPDDIKGATGYPWVQSKE